ncbi:hypothetical protein C8F04DRAFT_1098867, partial [Mycena alexandri]
MFRNSRTATAYLLSYNPSSATKSLLIADGWWSVYASHPRSTVPIQWQILTPPFDSMPLSTTMKVLIIVFIIPLAGVYGVSLLGTYLASGVLNCGVAIKWAYNAFFGPSWSQQERILRDADNQLTFTDRMRIQSLPRGFTLVTLTDRPGDRKLSSLNIRPLPGLGNSI